MLDAAKNDGSTSSPSDPLTLHEDKSFQQQKTNDKIGQVLEVQQSPDQHLDTSTHGNSEALPGSGGDLEKQEVAALADLDQDEPHSPAKDESGKKHRQEVELQDQVCVI